MIVLGIETTCDETAAAIVERDPAGHGRILSNIVLSQTDEHAAFGGVVFGWLGDRIGRVRAMALSILTYSLVTGLGYWAQRPEHLAMVRFVSALGMGGQWALGVGVLAVNGAVYGLLLRRRARGW